MSLRSVIIGIAFLLVILALGLSFVVFVLPRLSSTGATVSTTKVYHVGILNALDYFSDTVDGFKAKMTDLGYVEGKNIVYDVVKAPSPVGNTALIQKFVDEKVDLILVFPTEASLEARLAAQASGIPIISTEAGVEGTSLVDSIQHPGGHLTGVRFPIPEVAVRRLEILHELSPKATRIWIPYLKDYPTVFPALAVLTPQAKSLGVTLIPTPFSTPDEMRTYLKAHDTSDVGMDAVLLVPEPISIIPDYSNQVYAFADTHKLPIASATILQGDTGPAFGLIPPGYEFGQLAAPLADKIFRGADPGSMPMLTPDSKLQINLKVLKKLGITPDEGLLSTADKIVH